MDADLIRASVPQDRAARGWSTRHGHLLGGLRDRRARHRRSRDVSCPSGARAARVRGAGTGAVQPAARAAALPDRARITAAIRRVLEDADVKKGALT